MKKTIITTITVAVVVLLSIYVVNISSDHLSETPQSIDKQADGKQPWVAKIDEQSAVTITITPIDVSLQSEEWKFEVVMSTHSVELDQDMTKVAVLRDAGGRDHLPIVWEGAGPGGHHREGVLKFKNSGQNPKSMALVVKEVGGVAERVFTWELDK